VHNDIKGDSTLAIAQMLKGFECSVDLLSDAKHLSATGKSVFTGKPVFTVRLVAYT